MNPPPEAVPTEPEILLENVIAEFLSAVYASESPDRESLCAQHPVLANELREFFEDHDWAAGLAAPAIDVASIHPEGGSLDVTGETLLGPFGQDPYPDERETSGLGVIGDYELLEELGRGGMGVVFKARQRGLNRLVALKMILGQRLSSRADVERFRSEAKLAGHLEHLGIVPVYDVGQEGDQHYYAMSLIQGPSLHQVLVKQGELPPKVAAELIRRLAEAMAFAHQRGIVHRDLKPANVLLAGTTADDGLLLPEGDYQGRYIPKVTDFGLAKDAEADIGLTGTGQLIGTPSYMSPEQAAGQTRDIGPLSDVYSLGAILYCALTGRPPFRSSQILDTLKQVMHEPPVSLRRLNPEIPRDLETICLKCLQKSPADRYPSAGALAEDLRRFLENVPINARAAGYAERFRKWCRRRPAVAGLILASVVAFVSLLGTGIATVWSWQQSYLLGETEAALSLADRYLYFSRIGLAERSVSENHLGRARRLLEECPPELRGWEWDYLNRACHPPQKILETEHVVTSLAYTSDGRHLLTTGPYAVLNVLDAETGALVNRASFVGYQVNATRAKICPGARWIIATFGGRSPSLILFSTETLVKSPAGDVQRADAKRLSRPNGSPEIQAVAVTPDGSTLFLGGDGRTPTGVIVQLRIGEGRNATDSAFDNGEESIFDYAAYQHITQIETSPDGTRLAVASVRDPENAARVLSASAVEIWEVETRRRIALIELPPGGIESLSFSPDGETLAIGRWDGTMQLFSGANYLEPSEASGHRGKVTHMAFSPDGTRLASASEDRTVRLWTLTDQRELEERAILRGHTADVFSVAVHPLNGRIASGGQDMTIIIHEATVADSEIVAGRHAAPVVEVNWENSAERLWSYAQDGTAHEWTLSNSDSSRVDQAFPDCTWNVSVSHRARLLACATGDPADADRLGEVVVRDFATREERQRLSAAPRVVWDVEFSRDGRFLAASGGDRRDGPGLLTVFDVATGRERFRIKDANSIVCCAFSRDARYVAAFSNRDRQSTVDVWEVATGRPFMRIKVTSPRCLAFDPDTRYVVVGSGTDIGIFEIPSGRMISRMEGHTSEVRALRFSPDGRRLASAGSDRTVKIWDWEHRQEILTLHGHQAPVACLDFNGDGTLLASGSDDGVVRVWNATPRSYQIDGETRPGIVSDAADRTGVASDSSAETGPTSRATTWITVPSLNSRDAESRTNKTPPSTQQVR